MTTCEWCGTRIEDDDLVCSACGREIRRTQTRAETTPAPPPAASVASETAAPVAEVIPAAEPEPPAARCAKHAEAPSKAVCTRCGRFACGKCLLDLAVGKGLCVDCMKIVVVPAEQKNLRRSRLSFSLTMMVASVITGAVSATAFIVIMERGLSMRRAAGVEGEPIFFGAAAVFFLVSLISAIVFLAKSVRGASWAAVATHALAAFSLFAAGGAVGCAVVSLVIAIRGAFVAAGMARSHEALAAIEAQS